MVAATNRSRPKPALDCIDCGRENTMKLQNGLGTQPRNIPLLYICYACGTTFKIPPLDNPLIGV